MRLRWLLSCLFTGDGEYTVPDAKLDYKVLLLDNSSYRAVEVKDIQIDNDTKTILLRS